MRALTRVLACFGALLLVIILTPTVWYAGWMAGHWSDLRSDPRGGVLIVLGADVIETGVMGVSSYWRSTFAAQVWKEGGFQRVLLSGDPRTTASMRDWIVWQGVPLDAVVIEARSGTTRENALYSAAIVKQFPGPYVLLTSDFHMWRASRVFHKAGITVQTIPCPDAFKRSNDWRERPRVFMDLSTEIFKIGYYRARGWI